MLSSLVSVSNTETCFMMMHKLCISPLNLVYVFALIMYPKNNFHSAELHALDSDKYTTLNCKMSII